jgi:hypothetical protein
VVLYHLWHRVAVKCIAASSYVVNEKVCNINTIGQKKCHAKNMASNVLYY